MAALPVDPTGAFPLGAEVTLDELERDPHPALARLRTSEPVSWLPALGGWLVSRRDLVVDVLRDPATFTVDDPRFSTAQVVGPSMLSLDGGEHGRHRGPFARAFRPSDVRARYADSVRAETERLVGELRPNGAAELRRQLAGPLAVATVAQSLGISGAEPRTVLGWYDAIVAAVNGVTAGGPVSAEGHAAFDELRAAVESTLADGSSSSLLVSASRTEDGLGRPETVSNAAVLMFGGIETTEGMIANVVHHLLGHPEQLAMVRADRDLVPAAVEESLRLEPAAAVLDRYATADVEVGGAQIRRGQLVVASLSGANRDPEVFDDPDRFDVRRSTVGQHLAFGHGSHFCLGTELARLEARATVEVLLDRLPGLRLAPGHPSAPRGLVFRKPPELRVTWVTSTVDRPASR